MRRRDILKATAGTSAVLLAGGPGSLQIVEAEDADAEEIEELHEEVHRATLDSDAHYTVFTNFPLKVQHISREQFESGLLVISAPLTDRSEVEALSNQLKESGCCVGVFPVVTNLDLDLRHHDEPEQGILQHLLQEIGSVEHAAEDDASFRRRIMGLVRRHSLV